MNYWFRIEEPPKDAKRVYVRSYRQTGDTISEIDTEAACGPEGFVFEGIPDGFVPTLWTYLPEQWKAVGAVEK